MRALKDQALDTETRKPDARRGFMEDEEEVGDKAAIGDGDDRVITRISEGNQLRRANPSPTCLTSHLLGTVCVCSHRSSQR